MKEGSSDIITAQASEKPGCASTPHYPIGIHPLFVLCVSPQHRLAGQLAVSLTSVSEEIFIAIRRHDGLCEGARLLALHEIKPRVIYEAENRVRALELIGANAGVGVMASPINTRGVIEIQLKGRDFARFMPFNSWHVRRGTCS